MGAPSREAWPASISALTRERESEPMASARKRSARLPAASGGARASARSGSVDEGVGVAGLKALVIGMGVLIVVGTVALGIVLVQRLGGSQPPARMAQHVLGEPEGSRIGGIAAVDRSLAIWVVRPDGERVVLVDPASGRRTGEIRLRD